MSEYLSRMGMNTYPAVSEAKLYPDEQVVELLANPEVQQGLAVSEVAIAGHYRSLEEDGKTVTPILRGVTPNGDYLQVAEYSSFPDVQGEQRHKQYMVFAYPLSNVTAPGFTDTLTPRGVGYVREYAGGGIDVDIAKPGAPITVTQAHVRKAAKEGLRKSDPEAAKELAKAAVEQSANADKLHLPQVPSDSARFNNQPVVMLEGAAFGSRRQAVVDEVIAPLVAKRNEHIGNKVKAIGVDPEAEAREDALSKELNGRIQRTMDIMRADPVMIDRAGSGSGGYGLRC